MKIDGRINQIEKRVDKIEKRNIRVEGDKAWETSGTRAIFIALSTYVLIFIFMLLIGDGHPFLNAFVASAAYIISTTSYGFIKSWWLKQSRLKKPV